MIARRTLVLGGAATALIAAPAYIHLTHTEFWRKLRKSSDSKNVSNYFYRDWKQFKYLDYYNSLFELARANQFTSLATGPAIRKEIRPAFGGDNLHAAQENSLSVVSSEQMDDFTLHKVRFILDCGVPVVGCAAMPRTAPRGLVLLAHGMGTTPERCFDMKSPDYMGAIGVRLCAAGFAVWSSFMIQGGNQSSQNNLAGMLSLAGISYHNVICSALNLGPWVFSQMKAPDLRIVRYGMSWGTVVTTTLEAATSAGKPSILSGYLRDESQLGRSEWLDGRAGEPFVTYLHQLPNSANYFFPALAKLLRPCPLYFEIGNGDFLNSNTFGRDAAFSKIQSAYSEVGSADAVALRVFEGGHEVFGTDAINWLSAHL